MKKKVIISACLLGEYCRYDGKTKKMNKLLEEYKEFEIIPFCPEAPLFGTPRERISVVKIEDSYRVVTDETKVDVTSRLQEYIMQFYKENPSVDAIVLKSKSPSCGYKTTPIKDSNNEFVAFGSGIAATLLEEYYKDVKITDEREFE